jgi:hypothetical protein
MTRQRNSMSRSLITVSTIAIGLGLTGPAHAAEAAVGFSSDEGMSPGPDSGAQPDDSAAILAAGKVGAIAPFNGLGPFVNFGIEVGYIFGGTNRSLGALLDVTYTVPHADGTESEDFDPPRVEGGEYEWKLTQTELVLQPTFLYRFTSLDLGNVTPYVGFGPRIYFIETVVEGSAGGEQFGDSSERSTRWGLGLPLGAELALGPGGLFAEVLLQWGPMDHRITGDTHLGSATLFLGYRALL